MALFLHDAEEHVRYEALLYCWDQPELLGGIIVNGVRHAITQSLQNALEGVRRSTYYGKIHCVWAAGICINQADAADREEHAGDKHAHGLPQSSADSGLVIPTGWA